MLGNPATLLAANGEDFPDSVLAGAVSNAGGLSALAAVILTAGDTVPPETTAYLASRADDPEVIAIGAPAAIARPDVESVGSADHFDTSVAVAERFFADPRVVGLATSVDFAYALPGSSLIGRSDIGPGPMLLTNPGDLPASVSQYIAANRAAIRGAVIFGGVAAIDTGVRDEIRMISTWSSRHRPEGLRLSTAWGPDVGQTAGSGRGEAFRSASIEGLRQAGAAEQIALADVASQLTEDVELHGTLDALGRRGHPQGPGHPHDRRDQLPVGVVAVDAADERSVDLEDVDGKRRRLDSDE